MAILLRAHRPPSTMSNFHQAPSIARMPRSRLGTIRSTRASSASRWTTSLPSRVSVSARAAVEIQPISNSVAAMWAPRCWRSAGTIRCHRPVRAPRNPRDRERRRASIRAPKASTRRAAKPRRKRPRSLPNRTRASRRERTRTKKPRRRHRRRRKLSSGSSLRHQPAGRESSSRPNENEAHTVKCVPRFSMPSSL